MSSQRDAANQIVRRCLGNTSTRAGKRSKPRKTMSPMMAKVATVVIAGGGFISVVSLPAQASVAAPRSLRVSWQQIDPNLRPMQKAQPHAPPRKIAVEQYNCIEIQKISFASGSKNS